MSMNVTEKPRVARSQGQGKRKNNKRDSHQQEVELIEKLVHVNRVAKTVKGGRRMAFAALVVVGDGRGSVGFGTGKAREVPEAVRKATEEARKSMVKIPLKEGRTLHHDMKGHFGAGRVILRSAPAGTGIIAGGAMRAIFEAMGIQDVVSKSLGTKNPHNMIKATLDALTKIDSARQIAARRGLKVSEVVARRDAAFSKGVSDEQS